MTPETTFKGRMDRWFDRLFPAGYRTAIEKARGQKSGLPDRLYAASGAHCWAEYKVHPNRLSPLQEAVLPKMATAGLRVVALTLHREGDLVQVVQYGPDGKPTRGATLIEAALFKEPRYWTGLLLAPTSTVRAL
jgi:hypothetical protein